MESSHPSAAYHLVMKLKDTAAVFAIALGPNHAPKLALMWGLAYLTITVCSWALGIDNGIFNASSVYKKSVRSTRKWESFEKTLDDLRNDLIVLNINIKLVNTTETGSREDREMIGLAICQVFTLLIDFWIESVRWFDSAGKFPSIYSRHGNLIQRTR